MVFSEYPFLRYLLFFILGILLYPNFQSYVLDIYLLLLFAAWFIYLVLVLTRGKNVRVELQPFLLPVLAYFQLLLCGLIVSHLHDINNNENHLIHQNKPLDGYMALVLGQDEQKSNSKANRVLVKKFKDGRDWVISSGEVVIYHQSDTLLTPGRLLWVPGFPQKISEPTNPDEFDYKNFMLVQGVGHRHFLGKHFEQLGEVSETPIESFFVSLRIQIMQRIESVFKDKYAAQIAKALLLGQKRDLERDLSEAYATAGAMHVLAVSGLHVGIIYGFFFLWIKPYRLRIGKRVLYLSAVILLIWAYALLTGMSPSVMRAATMFSLMGLAQMKSRNPSIFNAIALSAFLLLVYNPMLIFAVGFQLSYVALLGILLIQPILVKIWLPKNRVLEYIWQISTVNIAAQLATFPLSAYYFHIFPVYFLISNLIAIPGAFLIMTFGLPFMILSKWEAVSEPFAIFTEWIIRIVNTLILSIQSLPSARISGLYLQPYEVFFYFIFLGFLLLLYQRPQRWLLWSIVVLFVFFGIYRVLDRGGYEQRPILTLYQVDKGASMDYRVMGNVFIWDKVDSSTLSFRVLPHRDRYAEKFRAELKAFGKEGKEAVLLPNGLILELNENEWGLKSFQNLIHEQYLWKSGKWEKVSQGQYLGDRVKAQKLVFMPNGLEQRER